MSHATHTSRSHATHTSMSNATHTLRSHAIRMYENDANHYFLLTHWCVCGMPHHRYTYDIIWHYICMTLYDIIYDIWHYMTLYMYDIIWHYIWHMTYLMSYHMSHISYVTYDIRYVIASLIQYSTASLMTCSTASLCGVWCVVCGVWCVVCGVWVLWGTQCCIVCRWHKHCGTVSLIQYRTASLMHDTTRAVSCDVSSWASNSYVTLRVSGLGFRV